MLTIFKYKIICYNRSVMDNPNNRIIHSVRISLALFFYVPLKK